MTNDTAAREPRPATPATDEVAWVIEDFGAGGGLRYWAGGEKFSFLHTDAIRFCRKSDAERVMEGIHTNLLLRVAEHMWVGGENEAR